MGNKSLKGFLLPTLALIAFIGVWQAICEAFRIETFTLPSPWDIAQSMYNDSEMLAKHALATLNLALIGLGLGLVIGIVVAVVLHLVLNLRLALAPFLILSQNIPLIALGPLLMIWFGFGITPKLILLVLVCFFPITLSMLIGLGQAEPQLREYMGMIGASRWERLKRLEFPASLSYLFSGLKIAATYVVSSAIVAEWLGANKGIGFYLSMSSKGFDQPGVFGSIVCIIAISLLFYYGVAIIERLVIRWKPRAQSDWKGVS